jgi:FlaG/FlaF family flagellin (archaellin)
MKSIIIYLSTFILTLFVISCSSPEKESIADATEDISIEITSRSLESDITVEQIDSMLIRQWSNKNSDITFNLINDYSFTGTFKTNNSISGRWKISEDQQTLKLESELSDDGPFELSYLIVEISSENMILQDDNGNEIKFNPAN